MDEFAVQELRTVQQWRHGQHGTLKRVYKASTGGCNVGYNLHY